MICLFSQPPQSLLMTSFLSLLDRNRLQLSFILSQLWQHNVIIISVSVSISTVIVIFQLCQLSPLSLPSPLTAQRWSTHTNDAMNSSIKNNVANFRSLYANKTGKN